MVGFEALEGRVLFAAGVTLTRADGAARSIVGRRETWIVIHGTDSSKDDPPIQRLADAVDAMSSRDQVLVVDWRDLASFTRDAQVRTAYGQLLPQANANFRTSYQQAGTQYFQGIALNGSDSYSSGLSR